MRRLHVIGLAAALVLVAPAAYADDKDNLKKEIEELNKITGDGKLIDKAKDLAKDKEHAVKLLKQADDMAKLDSKQFKYNAAYILAWTAVIVKEKEKDKAKEPELYDIAIRLFKLCEKQAREQKSATKIGDAFEGHLAVLLELKRFEDAEKLCNEFLDTPGPEELNNIKLGVFEQLILIMTRQGKVDDALRMTDRMIKNPDLGWYFYSVKGRVLHEAGRDEESAKTYLDAIDQIDKAEGLKPEQQDRLIDQIRYQLSNVYVELNQVDKAAEQLKTLLKKRPDNPGFNNDLGYIWADHDMNLDESEKLIRKAIDEDRKLREKRKKEGAMIDPEDDHDSAAYLDSLGWVLFKKKQYAEAKKPLLEAIKYKEGQHIEIMDHLADVYMALGEKPQAIETWKKALDQDFTSKRDLKRREEVIKKLKAAEGKK
jgi:tetratricopeptide (TPR) repeat protein